MTYKTAPPEQRLGKLGDIINTRRNRLGHSQSKAARDADISEKTWRMIEAGGHNPGLVIFMDVAKALEVRPSELLAELEAELGV